MIKHKLILASASPRRKFLLEQLSVEFSCRPVDIEEIVEQPGNPALSAEIISKNKAKAALKNVRKNEIVVAADTIVVLHGDILGKPETKQQAIDFLRLLAGKTHLVITGVCLMNPAKTDLFHVNTLVTMGNINREEILFYLNNWNAMDKAGAYGIQDWIGWTKIVRIEGSYSNVMGLPVAELYKRLCVF